MELGHQVADQLITTSAYHRPPGINDESPAGRAARGLGLPGSRAAGEVARQLWGQPGRAGRATLLDYARDAPLTYGTLEPLETAL